MNASDHLPTPSGDVAGRRGPERPGIEGRVDRILDAATDLIAIGGVDAITMDALADRADVTLYSLAGYFPNERAVLRALLERYISEMREVTFPHLTYSTTKAEARAAVKATMLAYWEFVKCHPAYGAVWAAGFADAEFAHIIVAASRSNSEYFLTQIGPALDESERSTIMLLMVSYLSGATARIADVIDDDAGSEALIDAFVEQALPRLLGLADET